MEVSVTDAKAQLTDLVRRAEDGEEVVLTRHGRPSVRLTRALMEEIRAMAHTATPGPCAARSQDFLYDDHGLPA